MAIPQSKPSSSKPKQKKRRRHKRVWKDKHWRWVATADGDWRVQGYVVKHKHKPKKQHLRGPGPKPPKRVAAPAATAAPAPAPPPASGDSRPAGSYQGPFGVAQANRLLHRAGFGPLTGQAEGLVSLDPAPTDDDGNPLAGGGVTPADAGECEWRPHKVRVVKHVKRHGKRVKLVRKRVRWSCVPVSSTAPPAPGPSAAPATPPPTPPPAPEPPAPPVFSPEDLSNPHFLGAQAYEFGFTPTKPSFELQAGTDTIEMINRGEDAHDLHLESLATGLGVLEISPTGSGGHARATALLEPGSYRLYCSLADHASLGMERTLVVTP